MFASSLDSQKTMNKTQFILASFGFACIIVLANFSVQYNIFNTPLTFGALTYPFSFLLMNILSEKYPRPNVLKTLWVGLALAFVPSILLAEFRIACASVCGFCCAQVLDVFVFYYLKHRFPKIWYLRNNGASLFSQFIDTLLFFHIAYLFIKPEGEIIAMVFSDYAIKVISNLCNTPLFYAFAIRGKKAFYRTDSTNMKKSV